MDRKTTENDVSVPGRMLCSSLTPRSPLQYSPPVIIYFLVLPCSLFLSHYNCFCSLMVGFQSLERGDLEMKGVAGNKCVREKTGVVQCLLWCGDTCGDSFTRLRSTWEHWDAASTVVWEELVGSSMPSLLCGTSAASNKYTEKKPNSRESRVLLILSPSHLCPQPRPTPPIPW